MSVHLNQNQSAEENSTSYLLAAPLDAVPDSVTTADIAASFSQHDSSTEIQGEVEGERTCRSELALKHLLGQMQSGKAESFGHAVREVLTLNAEELLHLGQREAKSWQRTSRIVAVLTLLSWLVGLGWMIYHPFGFLLPKLLNTLFGYALIYIGAWGARRYWKRMAAPREVLAERYNSLKDKRLVPAALLLLRDRTATQTPLVNLLVAALPHLTHDEVQAWSDAESAALLTVLEPPLRDYKLALAALKALEQVGDVSAVPVVQKLATMQREVSIWREDISKLFSPNLNTLAAQVKQEAQQVLPYLKARAEEHRQAHTLLRASVAADAPASDILLRPAVEKTDTPPADQLLRSSESDLTANQL